MNALYEELRIALHAVWQRRWLALGVAWAVAILGWTVIALIPNSYESKARVSVDMQSLLPSKIGIQAIDQQRGVDQVRQTLTSTVNLQKVVRGTDLSLYAPSDKDVAAMVETLRDGVTLKAQQDNLFELSARVGGGGRSDAKNAKLAKAVVQKLIDIFVDTSLADDRDETSQTIRFLDQELARRQAALQEAEQKKVLFEQEHMGLLPGVGSVSERLASAQSELGQVDSQLVAAQSSAAAMSGQLGSIPASIAVPGGAASIGGARGMIADLQGKIAAGQAQGWTEQHPDMVAMRNQIARLQPQAAREGGGGGSGMVANPAYSSLRSIVADRQATASALAARKAQLQADIAGYTARQAEQPDVAAQETQLSRDYDVLKAQYDKLLQDREDVRLRSDVNSKTDAIKFSVIDPPSDPRVPIAPKRPLLLTAILLLAIASGIGAAFAMDKLGLTFPTADRLATAIGLPVLGSISEVVTHAERELRARRLKWFAGAGGALGGVFVLLLAVEFVQRGLVA